MAWESMADDELGLILTHTSPRDVAAFAGTSKANVVKLGRCFSKWWTCRSGESLAMRLLRIARNQNWITPSEEIIGIGYTLERDDALLAQGALPLE